MGERFALTKDEAVRIGKWLREHVVEERHVEGRGWSYQARHPLTADQIHQGYQSWSRGGRGWLTARQGGTGIVALICWYQHVHKPGSREWRPSVILRAALAAATPTTEESDGDD